MMPPVCNTGVHPPLEGFSPFPHAVDFDWYRATVPASVEALTQAVLEIAGPYPQIEDGPGRFNYRYARTVTDGGDRVATILHGGSNGHPNVEASGDRSPALANLLRSGGEHKVTRCDPKIDLYGDDLYSRLRAWSEGFADRFRIGHREIKDRDPAKGNTIYLGSRKSAVFCRIYEKGKADRLHYSDAESDMLSGWVRLELEVKPQKEMKLRAATMQPAEFFGISAWTMELAQEVVGMSPDPVPFHPRRMASDDRAYSFMLSQYGALLRRRCHERFEGDREALAAEFIDRLFGDGISAVA